MARPRKTVNLAKRREELEAELAKVREAEEAEREQRAHIAGRAVLDEADNDPSFKEHMQAILERRVTKRAERALFGLPASRGRRKKGAEEGAESVPAGSEGVGSSSVTRSNTRPNASPS